MHLDGKKILVLNSFFLGNAKINFWVIYEQINKLSRFLTTVAPFEKNITLIIWSNQRGRGEDFMTYYFRDISMPSVNWTLCILYSFILIGDIEKLCLSATNILPRSLLPKCHRRMACESPSERLFRTRKDNLRGPIEGWRFHHGSAVNDFIFQYLEIVVTSYL